MTFSSAAKSVWLVGVTVLVAVFASAGGTPPEAVVLIVAGFLLLLIGADWALGESRKRRGRPDALLATLEDLLHLGRRGWLLTLAFGFAGVALISVGALVASRAGA